MKTVGIKSPTCGAVPVLLAFVMCLVLGMASPSVCQSATVTLVWDEPTTNTDGSALTDLATIKVYQDGVAIKSVPASRATGGGLNQTTTVTVPDPAAGTTKTYSFYCTAIDTAGNESVASNTVTRFFDALAPASPGNLR
jgi:hypothetical protein